MIRLKDGSVIVSFYFARLLKRNSAFVAVWMKLHDDCQLVTDVGRRSLQSADSLTCIAQRTRM